MFFIFTNRFIFPSDKDEFRPDRYQASFGLRGACGGLDDPCDTMACCDGLSCGSERLCVEKHKDTCAGTDEPCHSGNATLGLSCCDGLYCYEETVCIPFVSGVADGGTCAKEEEPCKTGVSIIGMQCCGGLQCYEETVCIRAANATAPVAK